MATSAIRTRNVFNPFAEAPYKISRSKLELFIECPRCFYLDRRLGIGRPSGPSFTLNTAVDTLLKKEFDVLRAKGVAHPLMKKYKINAIPFAHKDLDTWRENFVGVQFLHETSNFLVTGAVDDIWKNKKGELMVVDYKATSTQSEITLDAEYRQAYKRQMEIYQWLMRKNGFKVSDTGYFVYCNGLTDRDAFDGKLEFDIQIIPYTGSDAWVEDIILKARKCLDAKKMPKGNEGCAFCGYRKACGGVENTT